VLVAVRCLHQGIHVQASLVGKGTAPDVRRLIGRAQVGDFADKVGRFGQPREIAVSQRLDAHLELQVGDHRAEVGVAAALTIAVDGALHVSGASLHGQQRVGHGYTGVIVGMDAQGDSWERVAHGCYHSTHLVGEHATVCVAQHHDVGACLGSHPQRRQGIGCVQAVSVEKVLGVENDFHARSFDIGHGVVDHGQVLVERRRQHVLDVHGRRLAHDHGYRSACFDQRAHVGVAFHDGVGTPGAAKGGHAGVPQFQVADALKELDVLRVGPGPSALDVGHAQFV